MELFKEDSGAAEQQKHRRNTNISDKIHKKFVYDDFCSIFTS